MFTLKQKLIAASLLYTPSLMAQDANHHTLLKLNDNTGQYRVCSGKPSVCSIEKPILDNKTINIKERANGNVTVELYDLNKIFYQYSFGEISSKNTENYTAIKAFFDAVKKTPFGKSIKNENMALSSPSKIKSQFQASSSDNQFQLISKNLAVLTSISRMLEQTLESLYSGDLENASKLIDKAKSLVPRGQSAVKYLKNSLPEKNKILPGFIQNAERTNVDLRNEIQALLIFIENTDEMDKLFTFIKKLDELLIFKQDQKPCSLGEDSPYTMCKNIEVSNTKIDTLPINVKKNDEFVSFLDPAQVIKFKDKTYKINVIPYETFTFKIATGAFYDFIDSYSYSTEFKDGNLLITEKDNRGSKLNGMVALNVGLAKYSEELAQPIAQLGLLTSEGDIGFIAGVGITAFEGKASFTFGALYKKVETLSSGLSVGDSIDSQDALKTKKDFKSGLYIGVAAQF